MLDQGPLTVISKMEREFMNLGKRNRTTPGLQIRRGNKDNSKIIFLISE